jgi:hypothetical protein
MGYAPARGTSRQRGGGLPRDPRAAGGGGRAAGGEAGSGLSDVIAADGTGQCSFARTANNFVEQHW